MPARPLQCQVVTLLPCPEKALALCEQGWSRTKGSAQPHRLLLSMEMALTPLPPFPVTHCCTGCSSPSPTLRKKQKQRCNTKSDSGKCVQSFKYLPPASGALGVAPLVGCSPALSAQKRREVLHGSFKAPTFVCLFQQGGESKQQAEEIYLKAALQKQLETT